MLLMYKNMKKDIIEEVFLDQLDGLKHKETGISRDVNLSKAIATKQIVVISGVRRSGKSTLLFHLMKNFSEFSFLNFDDERLINFDVSDFSILMLVFKKYSQSKVIFLDEIQNVNNWERFVRRIFEEGYKIFITGSNAKLLSSELATHLTGRYIKIEVFPFSFVEILNFNKVDHAKLNSDNRASVFRLFDDYLTHGGFPEMIKYNDDEFLKRIYEDIIYKDLIARYGIRNVNQFKNLSQYLFTNLAGEISYNSLKAALNIKSANTIQEYVSYLRESYLIFELFKYDYSLKKQYTSNKKVYVIDNGVRNKIAFRFSDDKGKLLENLVFIELIRRQKELFFYKTKNNLEVDFLYYENSMFHLIQVSYSITNHKTMKREIKSLVETSKELSKTKCTILTYNDEDKLIVDKLEIEIIPVWKWLLGYPE